VDLSRRVEVGLGAGAEVIENRDLVTGRNISVDHVRTDESGSTCDKYSHRQRL
jgi:hypothetical protein